MMICFFCHRKIEDKKIGFRDDCPKCGRDLHICRNCFFYTPNAHRECRESIQERVVDKERANFCDFFRPGAKVDKAGNSKTGQAKKKFDDLFK